MAIVSEKHWLLLVCMCRCANEYFHTLWWRLKSVHAHFCEDVCTCSTERGLSRFLPHCGCAWELLCAIPSVSLYLNESRLLQNALHKRQSRVHHKRHRLPLAALPAKIAYPLNLSTCCSIQSKLPFVHKDAVAWKTTPVSSLFPTSPVLVPIPPFSCFFNSHFHSDELWGDKAFEEIV